MMIRIAAALGCLVLLLAGCANVQQKPLSLIQSDSGYKNVRIGVVMTQLPKVEMQYPGAGCLLCLAAASVGNSTLSRYADSLPSDDVLALKNELAKELQNKGADVTVIEENLNLSSLPDSKIKGEGIASKDFSSLQQKYKLDKLFVIEVSSLGISRAYSAYIPTSDPKGQFVGKGYIVNLPTNTYEWYQPITEAKSSDGNWDEPPNFPGLTNAYFQAIELAKDDFLKPFSN